MTWPSTFTLSVSRSALEPSSVIVFPFTETRPAIISSSALRRLVIPAWASSFWRRSSGIYFLPIFFDLWFDVRVLRLFRLLFIRCNRQEVLFGVAQSKPAQFFKFLQGWQFGERVQAKLNQELTCCFVQDWLAQHVFSSGGCDQLTVK